MGEPKIVVVDYHKGNLSSVVRGLARAGAAACTSDDPEQIRNADGLVIPGVGAFYDAIAFMRQSGEADAVLDAVAAGTPLLGICLGLQVAVCEYARNVAGMPGASSTEFVPDCEYPVIDLMPDQEDVTSKGGTMRLGAYPCKIIPDTRAFEAYGKELVEERHRHRYEFNNAFKDLLEEKGMVFSGTAPDGSLMEIVELPDHPWFLGCQFHPEFKSRPMAAHPLFREFIKAAKNNHKK